MERVFTDSAPEMIAATSYVPAGDLGDPRAGGHHDHPAPPAGKGARGQGERAAASELKTIPERSTRASSSSPATWTCAVTSPVISRCAPRRRSWPWRARRRTSTSSTTRWRRSSPPRTAVPQILAAAVLGGLAVGLLLAFLARQARSALPLSRAGEGRAGAGHPGRRAAGCAPPPAARRTRRSRSRCWSPPDSPAERAPRARRARAHPPVRLQPRRRRRESLVASNLAVSFAEAGHQVLLVDGDIDAAPCTPASVLPQRPGLADILAGGAARADALRATSNTVTQPVEGT